MSRVNFISKPSSTNKSELIETIIRGESARTSSVHFEQLLQERHICVLQSDQSRGHGKTTVALSSVIHTCK